MCREKEVPEKWGTWQETNVDNTVANACVWEDRVRKRETYTWSLPQGFGAKGRDTEQET